MTTKARILLSACTSLVGITILVVLGGWALSRVNSSSRKIVDNTYVPLVNKDVKDLVERHQAALQHILEADRDVHQAVIAEKMAMTATPDEFPPIQKEHKENIQQARDRVGKAAALFDQQALKDKYEEFVGKFDIWVEKTNKTVDYSQQPAKLRFARKISQGSGKRAFDEMRSILDIMGSDLGTRINNVVSEIRRKSAGANELARKTRDEADLVTYTFIGVGLVTSIISFLLSYLIARRISIRLNDVVGFGKRLSQGDLSAELAASGARADSRDELDAMAYALNNMVKSLREKARIAEAISNGDLTQKLDLSSTHDDLGKAIQAMTTKLAALMEQLNTASQQVAMGSGQLSDSSQNLSQQATEQAASIEEISSTLTEVASQSKANAENASQAHNLSAHTRDTAEQGNKHMATMLSAMNEINESSEQIAKIIKVIDDIAFQTNLLALNAAVEAARAGRHGKGFAVVAEEVRNLAGRSAKAARETSELIEGTVSKVKNGADIAEVTNEALQEIVSSAVKTTDIVSEIAAASTEQATGIDQMALGINQMETVTQQNSANAEETASAAHELKNLSDRLKGLLAQFQTGSSTTLGSSSAMNITVPPSPPPMLQQAPAPPQRQAPSMPTTPVSSAEPATSPSAPVLPPTESPDTPIINLDDDDWGKF